MKCFGYGSESCDREGTQVDPETPALFVNKEDPTGPKVQPIHCDEHHRRLMDARFENEMSWHRTMRTYR